MLAILKVSNYALIRNLEVRFHSGFNVITGETGAGKSVLLGALGLLTGKRADGSALWEDQKCVVEGEFIIPDTLRTFFEKADLDFENPCIIRREILPGGKSRAFVNDTPVNLALLQELNRYLVDIHSQHEAFSLADSEFRVSVVDAASECREMVEKFGTLHKEFLLKEKELKEETARYEQDRRDLDYLLFRLNELDEAAILENEETRLNEELQALTHAEEIQSALFFAMQGLDEAEENVHSLLKKVIQALRKVETFQKNITSTADRLDSALVEIRDISSEIQALAGTVESDQKRLEFLAERIALLQKLKKQHGVADADQLIEIRQQLRERVILIQLGDEHLNANRDALKKRDAELREIAKELHKRRKQGAALLEKQINEHLAKLNMPHARFIIQVESTVDFLPTGMDRVEFLFSANPGTEPKDLRKIASGGEMSRVMLAVKTILAHLKKWPTLIFDEIDTGISGKTADLAGEMMRELSVNAQVMAITHLPQIASKGNMHFNVSKKVSEGRTETTIVGLSEHQRIEEIARMLSGDKLLPEAVNNAKALLESVKGY
jgi:DNA repair protein RecN (Recombination protein N)